MMSTMRALIYTGPHSLEMGSVDKPVAAAGEVLVRVDSCGICGSDMHAWAGHDPRRPAPLVLGHEVSGHIDGGPRDGERVTVNPLMGCGTCQACLGGRANLCGTRQILSMAPRQGGFAQWVAIGEDNVVSVPEGFDLASAALVEPLACGWHAVRLAMNAGERDMRGDPALVIGGGAIGVGAALALSAQGYQDITIAEPNAARRARVAGSLNMATTVDASDKQGQFATIIDCVGFEATRKVACAAAAPGGVIAHIGLGGGDSGLDTRRMTLQEITFIGTYTYTPQDFRDTAAALFAGRLGTLEWTEQRPLDSGAAAFDDIAAGRADAPKIILNVSDR